LNCHWEGRTGKGSSATASDPFNKKIADRESSEDFP
jgi:hypothetical protein